VNWFDENIDPKYVKICVYAAVTTLATIALGLLIFSSGPLFLKIWDLLRTILEPFVYGMLFCYLLLPMVRHITNWLADHRIFRGDIVYRLHIAVAITVAVVAFIVVGVVSLLTIVITRSLDSVNLQTVQQLMSSAEGDITVLATELHDLAQQMGLISEEAPSTILGTFSELSSYVSTGVFSIVFGIYFLLDGARVFQYAERVFVAVFGVYLGPELSTFLADADNAFSSYIRGQFVDALVVGVITALSFTLLDVPYGPIIGLLTGIGNMIPYVGGPVGYATTALVCLAEGDFVKLAYGVIALSVIMFLDANVLNPRLLANAVEVHPLLVVIALIAGGTVGGLAGMLIAVPSAAFAKVQLERWLVKREEELQKTEAFAVHSPAHFDRSIDEAMAEESLTSAEFGSTTELDPLSESAFVENPTFTN